MRLNILAYKQNKKLLVSIILQIVMIASTIPLVLIYVNNWIYSYRDRNNDEPVPANALSTS